MTDNIIMEEEEEEELEINLRQRVRLFNLSEDGKNWSERGIGQISAFYFEKLDETFLLVYAETDGTLLLESKILQDTAYMKQQDRFIIWTEDEHVLGLSFQENAGCDDVWKIICQVQGKDPYVEMEPDTIIKEEIKQEIKEEIDEEFDENIKKEIKEEIKVEIKEEIKEEEEELNIIQEGDIAQEPTNVETTADNAQELWLEEMLDIEHAELSSYETNVLEQLIELVNRLVSPAPEDKVAPPAEGPLLDLYHMSEDMEETQGLQQLHETILYLLAMKKDRL